MADLKAYPNDFYSDDALINRIWYAGAYTVQTNIIANDTGRVWNPAPAIGWNNGAVVGELGSTVLVDGAKRDRTVWPGDLGISVPTDFVSLGDMVTMEELGDRLERITEGIQDINHRHGGERPDQSQIPGLKWSLRQASSSLP